MSLSASRINAAIRLCLDECYASDDPLACRSEFMTRLCRDGAWSKREVEHIHLATGRILNALLLGSDGVLADAHANSAQVAQGASGPLARGVTLEAKTGQASVR